MQNYDCLMPFKAYAVEEFVKFNSRQLQELFLARFNDQLDIQYLSDNRVILDHFFLHSSDRNDIKE